ncbi:MAG: hypothetical protein K2Q18_10060, partial [Bdellovibrionales bacterium]|nr:hypothetical protein [Bdellovibrionales bacterium]
SDIFLLKTTIDGKVFDDLLIITSEINGKIKGSLTVPGVFSSAIEKGERFIRWSGDGYKFSVTARENNVEYIVDYLIYLGDYNSEFNMLKKDGKLIGTIKVIPLKVVENI